jgi:hypothetical protein
MYKSRITKWNLDKNNKERDMAAILHKKTQRDGLGKPSLFRIRGRAVNIEDVHRYFKRRGPAPESEILARYADAGTPSDVSCSTPSRTHSPLSLGIPRSPLPPQDLLVPEQLFFNITLYFDSYFSCKIWFIDEEGSLVNTAGVGRDKEDPSDLYKFYDYCIISGQLVRNRLFVQARRALSKACSLIPSILRGESPLTLQFLLDIYLSLETYRVPEVATLLHDYMSKMSAILLDEKHPWRRILRLIGTINPNNLEAVMQARQCIITSFERSLGQFHQISLLSHVDFMALYSISNPQGADSRIRKLLSACEEATGRLSLPSLSILFALGENLCAQARYIEVESIGVDLIARAQECGNFRFKIYGLKMAAMGQYRLFKIELAQKNMGDAVELARQHRRGSDTLDIHMMAHLMSELRYMGLEKMASELAAEMEHMIGVDEFDE